MNKVAATELLTKRLVGYSGLIAAGAILGTLASLFGSYHFIFDLCTHFRFVSTPALMISGILLLIFAKSKWLGRVSVIAGIGLLVSLEPWKFVKHETGEPADIRIMLFNVLTGNRKKEMVADYILTESPDVAVLLEIDAAWNVALVKRLQPTYPHQLVRTRGDNFGIAVFSKQPFESAEIREFGGFELPSVDVQLTSLRIIGTHPIPPINSEYWIARNRQLSAIAQEAAKTAGPVIVCGDFNCSQWSPYMQKFIEVSGLADGSDVFGIRPTWKSFAGIIALPLDHIFYSKELSLTERKTGPYNGSDHKPVISGFRFR